MRFIITGRRTGFQWIYYVGRRGCLVTNGGLAAVLTSLSEAKLELSYWQRETNGYRWWIEKLPPRLSLANAVLRGEEVAV